MPVPVVGAAAATIKFINSGKSSEMTTFIQNPSPNQYGFYTWLFADSGFDTWAKKIDTEPEKTYAGDSAGGYSGYTLKIKCDITTLPGNNGVSSLVGSGCCLRDLSQKGGGYCTRLNAKKDGIDTNFLTDAQFETITKSPYDMSEVTELTTKIDGITSFQIDKDVG